MRLFVVLGGAVLASASEEKKASSVLLTTIKILEDMANTARKEMNQEKVSWASRSEKCTHDQAMMEGNEEESHAEIMNLDGAIGTQTGISAAKESEVNEHSKISKDAQEARAKNDAERKEDHAAYMKEKLDLEDAIIALDEAKRILASEAQRQKEFGNPKEDSLAFLQRSNVAENVKTLVASLLETKGMKEAAAYESNMGMVIELLEDEQRSVRKQLNQVEVGEINSKNAYNMLKQDYTNQIEAADRAVEEAIAAKQMAESDKATAEEQLASEQADLASTQKELAAWIQLCKEEGLSFDEKQMVRRDEITAVTQATEILEKVSLNNFTQTGSKSLLQVTNKNPTIDSRAESAKVSLYLSRKGQSLKSQVLSLLAEKIADDPFAKVTKMIEDMISKLVKERGAEQEKKIYCDTEIKKNKKSLERTSLEYDRASGEFAKQSSLHAKLTEQAVQLRSEVADLKAAMEQATLDREADKKANLHEISVCESDVEGVTQALTVLREFYSKMGSVTAFLQKGIKFGTQAWNELDDPNKPTDFRYGKADGGSDRDTGHTGGMATFGNAYGGQSDSANAVLAMLETVVESVNEKRVEIQKAEAEAAGAFDNFTQDSNIAVVQKETTAGNHVVNGADAKKKALSAKSDVNAKDRQLDNLHRAKEALLPTCPVWAGGTGGQVSFETRQKARQDEIDALKDALEMLKQ